MVAFKALFDIDDRDEDGLVGCAILAELAAIAHAYMTRK